MEFVFRPIEKLIEGSGAEQRAYLSKPLSDRLNGFILKWMAFILVAIILGNTFVAYLMGSHRMLPMILEGPASHQGPFLFMMISSAIILFQYGWFREQICLFVCPYGRLQSVLLDRDSKIVAYDLKRGEPRGKKGSTTGDCVDCKLCVRVCPTGIDIRNGLQLECIHCTACMDACDSIMTKVARPTGLIRYQTENEVEGGSRRILRPRLLIYAIAVLVTGGIFVGTVATRADFRLTMHRESGRDPFMLMGETHVVNPFRGQFINMTDKSVDVGLYAEHPESLEIVVADGPVRLAPFEKRAFHFLLKVPKSKFKGKFGLLPIEFKAINQYGEGQDFEMKLIGPVIGD